MGSMKVDYKNWVPKTMMISFMVASIVFLVCFLIFGIAGVGVGGMVQTIMGIVFAILFLLCGAYSVWCVIAYRAFSYTGKRKLSKQIITGVAKYINIPDGGKGLDVGCGSGALTIACAKKNRNAKMVGIDRWGKEYASFNKKLCESNALSVGIRNISFWKGDAIKLPFPNESFDAVTSNYVYHNISGVDKQKLLLETLRTLKKGGVFAIHDLMSNARYGDMKVFVKRLKEQGYERVELIDTTKGQFMTPMEAKVLMLKSSTLLIGKK
ncbi:transport ATP-binding protein CydC [Lachnospiraceae bacterium KM106-2]|nr:transport ATP-binding protein CydC [Lachnospiraceae bacterium KM106-2]